MPSSSESLRNWTEFELHTLLAIICRRANLRDAVHVARELNTALNYGRVEKEVSRKEVGKLLTYLRVHQKPTSK